MYEALAYYLFTPIDDPEKEASEHKSFFEARDVSGRIYISHQGINGQISGRTEDMEAYRNWLTKNPLFSKISFKAHEARENIFPRMTVKIRKQLVALDEEVDPKEGGEHVSPEKWKEMLESGEYLLLDVRNRYEWEIGHFENAVLPPLETFREFPAYAENLAKEVDPENTKVMMYCTGGIRCELYSALMKKRGFKHIYQLDGGVINYGLKQGSEHWKGKLFVFDDRLAVPIDGKEAAPVSFCHHCQSPEDTYYNCANMDCNALFLSCSSCIETYKGCCSYDCSQGQRVRSFTGARGNKPFRRKHLIEESESNREFACALDPSEPSDPA